MEPSRGRGAPARPAAQQAAEDALADEDLVLLSRYYFPDTDSDDDGDDPDGRPLRRRRRRRPRPSAPAPPPEVCAVCTERIDDAQLCNTFPCLHCFCIPCLKTWLPLRNSCPLCNAVVAYLIVGVQPNGSYSTIPVVNDPRTRREAEEAVRAGTAVDFIWAGRPGEPAPPSVTLGGRTVRALSPPARMGHPVTDSEDGEDSEDSDADADSDEDDNLADPTFHPAPARAPRGGGGGGPPGPRVATRGGGRGGAGRGAGGAGAARPAPAEGSPIVIGDSPPASPRRPSAAAPPVVPVAPRPRPAAEPPAPAPGAAPRQPAHRPQVQSQTQTQTQTQARARARTQARAQAALAQALVQALGRPAVPLGPRDPPAAQAQPRPAAPPDTQARACAQPPAPPQAPPPPLCAVVAAAASARKRPASASEAAPAARGPKRPSLPPPPGGPGPCPRPAPARAPAPAAAPPPPRPLAAPAAPPPPPAAPPPPPAAPPPPPVETREGSSLGPRPAEQGPRKCVRKTRHVDAGGAPAAPGPTRYLPISGVSSVVALAPYLNKTVTGDCLPVLDMETGGIGAYVVLVGRGCNLARAVADAAPDWARRTRLPEAAPGRVSPPEYPADPAHGLWMTPVGGMLFDRGTLLGGRSFYSLDSRHPWTSEPGGP
ncbi:ubiquitin E3 ligase ICP0 [Macacine alphaherpesvirus 1]|nr:ubiquitin E3 ligase ICP0 [Macacine alphaherpesvirus 1]ARS01770.1 ubiquitin E3 ligase ICP0 [Macacine alphaherpesvirus 1]